MRERCDATGSVSSYHSVIFESIPDDYKMETVLNGERFNDLSYVGIMKHLREKKISKEFSDNEFYSSEVLSHMAMDYINSARYLHIAIVHDRDERIVSEYLIPCVFCCKHSIELKLKECLIEKGFKEIKGHSVLEIWNKLDEKSIPHSGEITVFLEEVEKIDNNEMALRYGISKNLDPLQEKFKFDVDRLIMNTMFLFNVLDEYVVHKYRYKN